MQTVTTQRWLERWDRQQERYVGDREGRFAPLHLLQRCWLQQS